MIDITVIDREPGCWGGHDRDRAMVQDGLGVNERGDGRVLDVASGRRWRITISVVMRHGASCKQNSLRLATHGIAVGWALTSRRIITTSSTGPTSRARSLSPIPSSLR